MWYDTQYLSLPRASYRKSLPGPKFVLIDSGSYCSSYVTFKPQLMYCYSFQRYHCNLMNARLFAIFEVNNVTALVCSIPADEECQERME